MSNNPFYNPQIKTRQRKGRFIHWSIFSSLFITLGFLAIFLIDIVTTAMPAFRQTYIQVDVDYSDKALRFTSRAVDRDLRGMVSRAWLRTLPAVVEKNPQLQGQKQLTWVLATDDVDQWMKGHHHGLKDKQVDLLQSLKRKQRIELRFNRIFFTNGDSKLPEFAGIQSAIIGSMATLFVTMILAFPIGTMTAVYLEEFARDSAINRFIEVNINNLAAIPSILFGLLGLSVFINLFGLPRSSPVVGGMTLALMTLPIIIVSSRAALRSVPDSIRHAGYGLGLTRLQVVRGHVLPLAMPGMLTGSIIGLAQAMGETAPLIIIGMIAFIPDSPTSLRDPATVLPAQIFTWAGMPERAYVEKTAAGILVILGTLIALNSLAIYLRKKYEIKW